MEGGRREEGGREGIGGIRGWQRPGHDTTRKHENITTRHDDTYKVEGAGGGLGLCAAHVYQHDAAHDQARDEPLLHAGDLRRRRRRYIEAMRPGW